MPVYNEASRVEAAIKRLLDVELPCEMELIVVDDGSGDATPDILAGLTDPRVRVLTHPANRGKAAAVHTAAARADGDYVVVYDADLEYFPEDLPRLLDPVLRGDAAVVYGSRTFGSHNAYSFWYVLGNKAVTTAANILYNSYLSDLETCWKLLPTALWRSLDLHAQGFGLEPEITAKLLHRGIRPYEVPVSYAARGRADGKKLTWRDGLRALGILARERVRPDGGARARSS